MASRLELQTVLEELLGSRNVYFQPPSSVQMKYPAIVYSLNPIKKLNANNAAYKLLKSYDLTVIDEDPDSEIPEKVLAFPYCSHDRNFISDNLNHYVFTLYY